MASKHILKYEEWQTPSGRWHCNDVSGLCSCGAKWWLPCRLFNISPAEWVQMLIDYDATVGSYYEPTDYLPFHWEKDKYASMHKLVLLINRERKKKNFVV